MASVNENLNTQRPSNLGRAAAAGAAAGAPPAPPKNHSLEPKPRTPTDRALIAARPQTEAQRQQTVLEAVKAAQGVADAAEAEDATPAPKMVADAIGLADGIKEGARLATSADEIARLPLIGRAVQNGTRLGKFFTAIAESKAGKAIAAAFQQNKVLAPATRFLGRIAPVAGLAVAGYDIYDAKRVHQDPKASTTEKVLATTKAALSGLAGAAGVAAVALAPTGVGAAIAGGIALGAGLLSLGADLLLGKAEKER